MAELKMLAIDLGASSGRGIVGSFDGEKLTLRENHRFSNDPMYVNGRFTWDILRIYFEIKNSITKTVIDGDDIASMGIDTWGVDYGMIDKNGRLMANPIHYRDTRTENVTDYVKGFVSPEEIYNITGIQAIDFNTLNQLAVEKRDNAEGFDRADKILFIPDLLNYFLTGKMATEYTIASTGMILDANSRKISSELIAKLGIPESKFAPMVEPGTNLGALLPSITDEVGKNRIQVYTTASHDTASAVIAVPATDKDFIYISSGTWSLMGAELDAPLINDATRAANLTNEGGAMGTIRFLKNIMGLWIIQESRRQWKREGKDYSFAQMEAWAKECTPFRSLINVDYKTFNTPGNMPEKIRDYCRMTGQPVPETVGEVVRCIYESLALKYRYTVDTIGQLRGKPATMINVVGGGTKDKFLSQMTADACGIPVCAGPEEATAIGNLVMQAIAQGEIKDLAQAREVVANSFEMKHYQPCSEREAWDEAYARFCKLQ
ncbi:MAG: rhamnulokinase [Clostridia bacterium]|nr:rhamnulokinase [Oscillospiraceae bacterium]MBR2446255.1 rhamnulokinase [Clostridia bacterium]